MGEFIMDKLWSLKSVTLMGVMFFITIGYNACSNDAAFELRQDLDSIEDLNTLNDEDTLLLARSPKIFINNDAKFTKNKQVNLSFEPDGLADQMFVSNSLDCSVGGWEVFQKNKPWTLSALNQKTWVSVKYKYQDQPETNCVKDEIIHDNIAPVVTFTQGTWGLWTKNTEMRILFQATDSGSGVKLTECDSLGTGSYSICGSNFYFSSLVENQDYQFSVIASDNAGNVSTPQRLNWRSDQTAPSLSFTLTPAAITSDLTPDFVILGNDLGSGVASYECKLDGATQFTACIDRFSFSNLSDGSHTLIVRAIDNVGHISLPITYTWVQDTTAPTMEFTQVPSTISVSRQGVFGFQGVNGGIQSYQCKVDSGAYQNCVSTYTTGALADGNHSFSVKGRDAAGNTSSPITYSWLVDTVAPSLVFTETPSAIESLDSARFGFSAQDTGSGIKEIQCRIDSNSFAKCATATVINNLSGGRHTLFARSLDKAGQYSPVISYQWDVDLTAPTVQITSTPTNPTKENTASFTFTASDVGSGVDFIECRIDGNPYAVCVSPKVFLEEMSDGQHSFSVRAYDKSGRVSKTVSYQWLVDTLAPTLQFIFKPNTQEYIGSTPKIRFLADDGLGSGVKNYICSYNSSSYSCDGDISYNFAAVDTRDHTFQVTVFDNVGNSSTSTVTWSTSYQIVSKQLDISVDGQRAVDILFVIDNSVSMDSERANLAQRFNGLLSLIDGLDWQIAVTTTDIYGSNDWEKGRITAFKKGTYILDSTMDFQTAETLFGRRVQNIPSGDWREQGVYATVKVIERALDGTGNNIRNAEFIRKGADLAVVVLSDEDENSTGVDIAYTPQQFLDFVSQSYGGQKNITWHSIVTMSGDVACKNSDKYPQYYGSVYEELSRLTGYGQPGGAIIGSVCAQDYTSQLSSIGQSVRDMKKTISLQCSPVDSDGDGIVEMSVVKGNGSGVYVPYSGTFIIQGQKIVFDDFLSPGDYQFNFNCVK